MANKSDFRPEWVRFFFRDLLTDLWYCQASAAERGVYVHVLMLLYAEGGTLPDDSEAIRKLVNWDSTDESFEKVWSILKTKFLHKRGKLCHKRVTAELDRAFGLHKTAANKGKKGGRPRKNEKAEEKPSLSPAKAQLKPSLSPAKEEKRREENRKNRVDKKEREEQKSRSLAVFGTVQRIESFLGPESKSDRTNIRNIVQTYYAHYPGEVGWLIEAAQALKDKPTAKLRFSLFNTNVKSHYLAKAKNG